MTLEQRPEAVEGVSFKDNSWADSPTAGRGAQGARGGSEGLLTKGQEGKCRSTGLEGTNLCALVATVSEHGGPADWSRGGQRLTSL